MLVRRWGIIITVNGSGKSMTAGAIARVLDDLAAQTWHKVELGPQRGLTFGEDSLTDHNLFELDRQFKGVEVYRFNQAEEPLNGADFEWWVGSDSRGWVGIRFQAKKLDDGAYLHLGHRVGQRRQYDLLLQSARRDRVWPLYCFYNGWEGGWPSTAKRHSACPEHPTCTPRRDSVACVRLEHMGCAVAPADAVARRHSSLPQRGRLALDDYLKMSWPWSRLLRESSRSAAGVTQTGVVYELSDLFRAWFSDALGEVDKDPHDEFSDALKAHDTIGPKTHFGIPEGQDVHWVLPGWLAARRRGEHAGEIERPRLAMIVDTSAL